MDTKTPLAGTAHALVDGDFIYLTRLCRIPIADIRAVRPSRDGRGATVVTSRGAMRVNEDYEAIARFLYGVSVGDAIVAAQGEEARE